MDVALSFDRQTGLWYYAIAWEFELWVDHILETFVEKAKLELDTKEEQLLEDYQDVKPGSKKAKVVDILLEAVYSKQLELIETELDVMEWPLGDGPEHYYEKLWLLEQWLRMRNHYLDKNETHRVVGYTDGERVRRAFMIEPM